MSYKVMDVAQYIINFSNDNNIEITNLKLQKLLYYVQAAFLIDTGNPCFQENIINWRHGPVVPEVYDEFKSYASDDIDPINEYIVMEVGENFKLDFKTKKYEDNPILQDNNKGIINKVVRAYKDVTPWELVERTHQEDPWLNDSDRNQEITQESISKYFSKNENRIYGE